jgi:hypothetical protein
MSKKTNRITEQHPEYLVNFIDHIRKLDPSPTGKYVNFLIQQFKEKIAYLNKVNISSADGSVIKSVCDPQNDMETFICSFLFNTFDRENLYYLWEFDKHLNENRIETKDIQQYKTWDDIKNATYSAKLKEKEKEYRKQIIEIYEDPEWLLLKPLSFEASLAYGAGTRWCTASKNNPSYFYRYSENGVLIYILNKSTNKKCAMFAEINKGMKPKLNISFWTDDDVQVDSLNLNLPDKIMGVLRDQINDKTQLKPNKFFFNKSELQREKNIGNKLDIIEIPNIPNDPHPQPIAEMGGIEEYAEEVNDYEEAEEIEGIGEVAEREINEDDAIHREFIRDVEAVIGEIREEQIAGDGDREVEYQNVLRILHRHQIGNRNEAELIEDVEMLNEALSEKEIKKDKPYDEKTLIVPSELPQFEPNQQFNPAPWLLEIEKEHVNFFITSTET